MHSLALCFSGCCDFTTLFENGQHQPLLGSACVAQTSVFSSTHPFFALECTRRL